VPRAKNTDRAEARRRYRDQQRAADAPETAEVALEATAPEPSASLGDAMRGSLRMPNIVEDLRALPGMFLRVRKLWIPVIALIVSFLLALALELGSMPEGLRAAAALYVQLTLPPTALFVFFVGGFLAPRASYLVGGVLGILDGILWSALFLIVPTAQQADPSRPGGSTTGAVAPADLVSVIGLAILIGVVLDDIAKRRIEPREHDHRSRSRELGLRTVGPLGKKFHGGRGHPRIGHLGRDRPLPDQVVQGELVGVEFSGDFTRGAKGVTCRTNRLMGFLGVLDLAVVGTRGRMHELRPIQLGGLRARRIECLRGERL